MAKNEIFKEAKGLSLPVGTGIVSGDPVRIGILNGVAQTNSGDNETSGITTSNESGYASVWFPGEHRFSVTCSAARAIGDPVYATTPGANKKATLSDSSSGAKLFGAFGEAVNAAGTVNVGVIIIPFSV